MSWRGAPRKQPLVLFVDDDPTMHLLAREALEGAGMVVQMAADGREGLSRFKAERPDLALLDVEMPGLDGFGVCREIRKHPEGQDLAVLLLTGRDDIDSISRAYEVGATDFVPKPINWLILIQRLRYMLRASRSFWSLRQSEERLANAQRIARLGNWELDLETREMECSQELHRILGLPTRGGVVPFDRVLGRVHPEDVDAVRRLGDSMAARDPETFDYRTILPDGSERIIHSHAEMVRDEDGQAVAVAGTFQDVTERKLAEDRIRFLAYHDSLTGLANRRLFQDRTAKALRRSVGGDHSGCILFLDLDHFKRINDTLGHAVGDLLLEEVAERIVSLVRTSDLVARPGIPPAAPVVSRLGGDEFTIMLTGLRDGQEASAVAQRILDGLQQPFHLSGTPVTIGASIGIAVWPSDGEDVDTLLRNADTAMYHAKEKGRGNWQFYQRSMNEVAVKRLQLEADLRRAIEADEFEVFYQPKVSLASGRLTGAEGLVRWRHAERGLIPPSDFVGVAEESRLIVPIGEAVLRKAIAQHTAWRREGLPPVRIAVNLSAQQLSDGQIGDLVRDLLERGDMEPCFLELEITESALMRDERVASEVLESLRVLGVGIALDDFGTGYSSLSHLKRFPVDTVKIDRSFVRDIAIDPEDAAITEAVIHMGKALKLDVVGEGVETEQQRDFLVSRGCDEIQGYLISPPVPPAAFAELIRRGRIPA